jgi:metallo-beta-lactamase family protein
MGHRDIQDEEGKKIKWRGEVLSSSAFSSHADQNELLSWIKNVPKEASIYLNHGELEAKEAFREKLTSLGWKHVKVPHAFTEVEV